MTLLSDLTGLTPKQPPLASKQAAGPVDPYKPGEGVMYGYDYTPNLTPTVNVTSAKLKAKKCLIQRNGPNVIVSGSIDVGSTLAGNAITKFTMDLPIPSDLGFALDLSGSGGRMGDQSLVFPPIIVPVIIRGDATNNRAEFVFNSNTVTVQELTFVFQYGII